MTFRSILLSIFVMLSLTACSYGVDPVNLADLDGWDIVVADDAIPSENYAAEEFQRFFEQASGVKLPIDKYIDRPNHHIFIGTGELLRSSDVAFSIEEMGEEESRIIVRNDNIAIAGGRPRGTLYGVYTFLEDYMGVRFLTHDHTYVPTIGSTLQVGPIDSSYQPPFELFRICGYPMLYLYPDFGARMRQNAYPFEEHPELGGRSSYYVVNHSFYRYLPLEEYAQEHPEYYGVWEGKRANNYFHTSLCFTNPDVPRIISEKIVVEMDKPANAWKRNFSVSQMDTIWQYCQCDKCMAIDTAEESHMGALLTMVNKVAEEVEKTHPDHFIGTLAYGFSRKPPRNIVPRKNVQICLAPIRGCQLHSFDDPTCPSNVEIMDDLKGWAAKDANLLMWLYGLSYYDWLLPYPNLYVFKRDFMVAHEYGVKGMYLQCGVDATEALEFSDLRAYVICRLLNNPSLDTDMLIDEFVTLHYDNAGPYIRQFLDMVHKHYADAGVHHASCISPKNPTALANWSYQVDAKVADEGVVLFEKALQAAQDDVVKKRVRQASVCAYRAAIEPIWQLEADDTVDEAVVEKMKPLCETFFALCDEFNLNKVVEKKREVINKLLAPNTVSMNP